MTDSLFPGPLSWGCCMYDDQKGYQSEYFPFIIHGAAYSRLRIDVIAAYPSEAAIDSLVRR